ncbi:Protein of unknown function [Gryllus bimaculatus]|nr:Protein of unknown function [Gryllus bimaculatus]
MQRTPPWLKQGWSREGRLEGGARVADALESEQAALERAQRREEAAAQLLSRKREDVERLRAQLAVQARAREQHIDDYCAEMEKIIREARAAPAMYEEEQLARAAELERARHRQQAQRLQELDRELEALRREAALEMTAALDDDLSIRAVEAETQQLTAEVQLLRESPQRAAQARAASIAASASASASTAPPPWALALAHAQAQAQAQGQALAHAHALVRHVDQPRLQD